MWIFSELNDPLNAILAFVLFAVFAIFSSQPCQRYPLSDYCMDNKHHHSSKQKAQKMSRENAEKMVMLWGDK